MSSAGWSLGYRDLDRLSDETAVGLAGRGVVAGQVVALVLPPSPEYVVLYVALAKLGAVTAGVNARLTPEERAGVIGVAAPETVLATATLAESGDGRSEVITVEEAEDPDGLLSALRVAGAAPDVLPDDPDRDVAVIFTSGTTGLPKGAVFGNRQLSFITEIDTGGQWGGGGPTLGGTSMAHLGPMTKLPGNLMRGTTTHILPKWRAHDALRLAAEHRMVGLGGIPTQMALMLREPDFESYDLSALRAVVIGGGPATPALIREIRARVGAAVSVRYSCTEAGIGVGTAFDAPPEDAEVSVGRAHPGVELTIRSEDGTVLPAGEVGEVCLRSPAVMSGYHRDPDATAATFTADGAVRTGDLGSLDDEGRLRLAGRTKEMYVRGGYNVYPLEVEAVLAQHPDVADVAVVGRPDDVMGEVGVAFVVPRRHDIAPSLEDLRGRAEPHLARHKLPEEIRVVEQLPLTAMDKVDRVSLRRSARGRHD